MNSNVTTSYSGIGFSGLLTIVFIVMKIMGYITWSWWWVFSPIWISIFLVIGILLIAVMVFSIYEFFKTEKTIFNLSKKGKKI